MRRRDPRSVRDIRSVSQVRGHGGGFTALVGEASQYFDLGDFRDLSGKLVAVAGGCLAIASAGGSTVLLSPPATTIDERGGLHIPGAGHTYRVGDQVKLLGGDLVVNAEDFGDDSCAVSRVFSYDAVGQ